MRTLIGALDAGGTTFKCAVLTPDREILEYVRIPTTTPEETFEKSLGFFAKSAENNKPISALGIACFGPLNLDRKSKDFGTITNTPKPEWSGANPKAWFENRMGLPVYIETDVNAALLAEQKWGAAKGASSAVYITVGTGIGAGVFANGDLLARPHHPEFGHIPVERHPLDKDFTGLCSFHGTCLEGMASAPALWKRHGDPEKLPANHEGWEIIADYLAQACQVLMLTVRPQKILLGGGLMQAPHIIPQIHRRLSLRLNQYAGISDVEIQSVIVSPVLGDNAGLFGGAALAL